MSTSILVIGESGSGKSTSARNLDSSETYFIKVIDKPLPFKNKYKKTSGDKVGNLFISDNHAEIIKCINHINEKRPEIKNIVIDDFQYIMANEFMRKSDEKGYQKFTDLAKNTWEILNAIPYSRHDLLFFILTHSELDANGKYKAKTIGKMLDEKITLEGLFTVVLHSIVKDDRYFFLTQNDGLHIAKSPIDLFENRYIENDLLFVKTQIDSYYNQDIPQ
jgi:AAA domain-containing protein